MKKKIYLLIFLLIAINVKSQQLDAVYVLSEGGFTSGSSALSKWDAKTGNFTQSIFNPGNIGLFPDGLIHHGEYLYLTEQGSFGGAGKIYKLQMDGTVADSREVGVNPYSLTISNEKIYLTNAPAGNVSIINLNDFSDVKTVTVGAYPQEIISFEGKVFVANNSLYGGAADSTVSVIDSETDEVIHTIKGRRDPFAFSSISLAISSDDHLLFACPGSASSAILYKVELNEFKKIDSMMVEDFGFDKDIVVDQNSDKVYFKSSNNEIVEFDPVAKSAEAIISDENLISINGYAYDHISGLHFVVDAKDFVGNGSFLIYDNNGNLKDSYETSIAPRRIVLDYSDQTVSVADDKILSAFRLEQNYPNPFNPVTTIRYTIPNNPAEKIEKSEKRIRLTVYDAIGNKISTLVNELKQPGKYKVNFNADNLASGVYYYRIQAGAFTSARKMTVLK